ncbi:hypothetical protein LRS13_09270 [Svornostia abyssi]|uniref:Methyltransferase FkbM domain-containing protein n=1 Tax=Svornostia abyssi TaxID=2898438 RepID=A0ABY5PMQ5_9ACTN|nr:hypothetical protein LRS13_09270 [Parviterribacteraceae bacterium J379]
MGGLQHALADYLDGLVGIHGPVVAHGPFRGMRYPAEVLDGANDAAAKLLGTYECELADLIEHEISLRPPAVVNVGAGEGYYAVGFAMRLPGVPVYAYDINPDLRALCRALAAENSVADGVFLDSEAHPLTLNHLAHLSGPGMLIVCDIEGAERDLLDPGPAPLLAGARLIVEVHDFVDPTISATLTARFASTHRASWIDARPRYRLDHPQVTDVPGSDYID